MSARKTYVETVANRLGAEEIFDRTRPAVMAEDDDFVPITGVVHLRTSLGVFLAVDGQRVFILANCTSAPSRVVEPAETVTIELLRSYARRRQGTLSKRLDLATSDAATFALGTPCIGRLPR
jgi:hypothetical protein